MARFNDRTEFDRRAINDLATSLEKTASDLKDIGIRMESNEMNVVDPTNAQSGMDGYRDFCKFVAKIHEAFLISLGTRYAPAIQESSKKAEKASKTVDEVHEKAETVLKTARKKKPS
jgi:uncharacterized protein Yka (UPF0111/DUF47 family)